MTDMMTFPDTWEEYEQLYGITDTEQVYTNGARLIPSFRVKQWLDYIAQRTGEWRHDGSDWTNRWICSRCGYKWVFDKANYCPNCGADMRGDDG